MMQLGCASKRHAARLFGTQCMGRLHAGQGQVELRTYHDAQVDPAKGGEDAPEDAEEGVRELPPDEAGEGVGGWVG